MIKDLFASKKWRTMLTGVVLDILIGMDIIQVDPAVKVEIITGISALFSSFVIGQGVADHGKEKEKVIIAAANGEKK